MKALCFVVLALAASCFLSSCTKTFICTCTTTNPATGAQGVNGGANMEYTTWPPVGMKKRARTDCDNMEAWYQNPTVCTLE